VRTDHLHSIHDGTARDHPRVVGACYCPNGHSLLYARANFSGHPGILLKIAGIKGTGHVVLSPIYGEKSRIALDVDLVEGEKLEVMCPFCDQPFAELGPCPCGASLITIYTTPIPDCNDYLGLCNRVGCPHAEVKTKGDIVLLSMMKDLVDS
jgi:hypothetical protein